MEEFLLGRNMGSGTRTTRNRFTPNLYHRTGHRMLPKSLPQSCFESPCLGATEGMKPGARDERVRTLLQGCTCSIGSPVFDPWFNSEDTPAEVLEIPCSLLPVCCHSGIV